MIVNKFNIEESLKNVLHNEKDVIENNFNHKN
jgi:hypothetical protein